LRLKAFVSQGVDNLPTVALPFINGDNVNHATASSAPELPISNEQSLVTSGVSNRSSAAVPSTTIKTQGISQPSTVRKMFVEPEIENGQVILHRSPNFIVYTTNHLGRRANPLRRRTGYTALLPTVTPEQEKRISGSETRLMPKVTPINAIKKSTFSLPTWLEICIVGITLVLGLLAHSFNLFSFPHYELDEGTYMSNAWAILHGMLEPYPYGYGHPPAGWIQIAAWVQLTGGLFTFGNALNSGRILMVFYALCSAVLVYLIGRRLLGSRSTSLLAMVIFSLSPLSIVYQRQIFLDNIGTFWLLLSLYLLVTSNSRLLYILCSAISFGLALLSKEIFVLFIPVMMYGLWLHTTRFQRKFAFVVFSYTIVAIGSLFLLLALLKGELLPTGMLPWDHHPHLSLFDTYLQQAQRTQSEGSFGTSWQEWISSDILIIAISIGTTLFNLITGWWQRKQLFLALLAISFWILLIRGGVIFPFYFIPMIPLAALNAAGALHTIVHWIGQRPRLDWLRVGLILSIILVLISYDAKQISSYTSQHPADAQTNALLWIQAHVPQNSFLVINSYFFTDLRERGGEGVGNGAIYPYANIYWNVAYDPEIHDGLLKNDWNRIDYIVTDTSMLNDIKTRGAPMLILEQALNNSVLRAEFQAQDRDQHVDIRIYQVLHPQASPIVDINPMLPSPSGDNRNRDVSRSRYDLEKEI